ncbi:MAG: Methionine synthase [Syntrophorhabdus sp. PtaU1.Bin050]|nr:MAG: Methionine synthase [Syntrophorhabdus sp. PtaU1.Bin050]
MIENELYIISRLIIGVRDMDEEMTVHAANEALRNNIDPVTAINEGLVVGMNQAGALYEKEEYFVPELLLCSDALYAGLDVLSPHVKPDTARIKHRVVIGVVEGDTHDIGKNLVKLMLEVSGFDVCDLGRDVPLNTFVDKVVELRAEVLCMSTLMSTTMDGMDTVIRMLEREGIRDSVKVMVGGGPLSRSFADRIGADGYSKNATGAAKLARQLTRVEADAV